MTKKEAIKLFEERKVRTVWDDELEKWYFSIVDVIGVLTDSPDPRNYWKVLKNRLKKELNETVTNCNQLKLVAEDGKKRLTDVADTEQLFRLIQSVPSPKAEPFKGWMAQIASERIDALVAEIAHISRSKAKEMIQQGLVQVNHITLEAGDKMCDNNDTISIRGYGRFKYLGVMKQTRSNRILAEIEVSI